MILDITCQLFWLIHLDRGQGHGNLTRVVERSWLLGEGGRGQRTVWANTKWSQDRTALASSFLSPAPLSQLASFSFPSTLILSFLSKVLDFLAHSLKPPSPFATWLLVDLIAEHAHVTQRASLSLFRVIVWHQKVTLGVEPRQRKATPCNKTHAGGLLGVGSRGGLWAAMEWGERSEKGLLFLRGNSACAPESALLGGCNSQCHILAAATDLSCWVPRGRVSVNAWMPTCPPHPTLSNTNNMPSSFLLIYFQILPLMKQRTRRGFSQLPP